jgi:hypothetical protein
MPLEVGKVRLTVVDELVELSEANDRERMHQMMPLSTA